MYTKDFTTTLSPGKKPDSRVTPSMNFDEDVDKYILTMALPGLQREDINITIQGNTLHVHVSATASAEPSGMGHHEYDVSQGKRSFEMPRNAEAILIHAFYQQGELTLYIPKGDDIMPLLPQTSFPVAIY